MFDFPLASDDAAPEVPIPHTGYGRYSRARAPTDALARYTRLFPLGERFKLEFIAESTNVFNRTNVVGLNSTATVDAAGNIFAWPSLAWTSALDQRLLQLGLKLSF